MFLSFGFKDAIDILLVAILLFQVYRLMKSTGVVNIFVGIATFLIFWFLIVKVFKLEMLGAILNQVVGVGAILIVVIFHSEIRNFFNQLGSRKNWRVLKRFDRWVKRNGGEESEELDAAAMKLVLACRNLARVKCGALIAIERTQSLSQWSNSGEEISAPINTRLIESIFFKNSPLHDGAMVIKGDKIAAACAILPVSKRDDLPRHLGLRHRSAMGLSEVTDATVIIVSEESGTISIAENGEFKLNLSAEELVTYLRG